MAELLPLHAGDFRHVVDKNRGHPLIIAFWATWCEPCREELPRLQRLVKKSGTLLITVSADEPENQKTAEDFLRDAKVSGAAYRIADASLIGQVDADWSGVLPAIFVYDAGGLLTGKFFGETDWIKLKSLAVPRDKYAKSR